jgi:diguanylate cyclase (GGDEF)-like protein
VSVLVRRAAFGVAAAVIVALIAASLVADAVRTTVATNREVTAAASVLGALDRLLLTVIDAETSLRGFVISGDGASLTAFDRAVQRFEVEMAALSERADAVAHREALDAVREHFATWLRERAAIVVDLRHANPSAVARAAVQASAAWALTVARHADWAANDADPTLGDAWAASLERTQDAVGRVLAEPLASDERTAWSELEVDLREYRRAVEGATGDGAETSLHAVGEAVDEPFVGEPAADQPAVDQPTVDGSDVDQPAPAEALGGQADVPSLAGILDRFADVGPRLERAAAVAEAGEDEIEELLVRGPGRELVPGLRATIDEVRGREAARLELLVAQALRSQGRGVAIAWTAPLVAVITALLVVTGFLGDVGRQLGRLGRAAHAVADGQEVIPIGEHGPAALRSFTRDFDRMAARVRSRDQAAQVLSDLAALLQAARSVDEAVAVATEPLARLFPRESGSLWLMGPRRDQLRRALSWGPAEPTAAEGVDLDACWALRQGRVYLVSGANAVRCSHDAERDGTTACVPLISREETLGVLSLHQPASTRTPALDTRLLRVAAEQLALALTNLRLRAALEQQSMCDSLTGLFNRRFLDQLLGIEADRATRAGLPLSALMVDVDHFKDFNDTHGHDAGDAVLRAVAQSLERHVRAGDVACRFGGEEFALLLPGADLAVAAERAQALRSAIGALTVTHEGVALPPVRASVGVACEHGGVVDGARLLRRADQALYAAKRGGRDRVEAAV